MGTPVTIPGWLTSLSINLKLSLTTSLSEKKLRRVRFSEISNIDFNSSKAVNEILWKYGKMPKFVQDDVENEIFETAFYIEIPDFTAINELKKDLKSIYSIDQISFFDSKGMA